MSNWHGVTDPLTEVSFNTGTARPVHSFAGLDPNIRRSAFGIIGMNVTILGPTHQCRVIRTKDRGQGGMIIPIRCQIEMEERTWRGAVGGAAASFKRPVSEKLVASM
jgi:hypothetical protein